LRQDSDRGHGAEHSIVCGNQHNLGFRMSGHTTDIVCHQYRRIPWDLQGSRREARREAWRRPDLCQDLWRQEPSEAWRWPDPRQDLWRQEFRGLVHSRRDNWLSNSSAECIRLTQPRRRRNMRQRSLVSPRLPLSAAMCQHEIDGSADEPHDGRSPVERPFAAQFSLPVLGNSRLDRRTRPPTWRSPGPHTRSLQN
jgi:hypothetical protein